MDQNCAGNEKEKSSHSKVICATRILLEKVEFPSFLEVIPSITLGLIA